MKAASEKIAKKNRGINPPIYRWRIIVTGMVQGVGFRPFVYRLAQSMDIKGWVANCSEGVCLDIECDQGLLDKFLSELKSSQPPLSEIEDISVARLEVKKYSGFSVRESNLVGQKKSEVTPDIATCSECLGEIFDPNNRRYRYPFTNCTNCGPRFSIIRRMPYDRHNTTMDSFEMCEDCLSEYDEPTDRRFHAQPNACHKCGPQLEYWDKSGNVVCRRDDALIAAAEDIKKGKIIALKGLGGFQLLADARNEATIKVLRKRKRRQYKPFAVMFPDIALIEQSCLVNLEERKILQSVRAPIVLLRKNYSCNSNIAASVAPDNDFLGAMLPYTPLHHLLMSDLKFPIVATSGNRTGEPICIDEYEALDRLGGIADTFLVHNRPIERPVDDSVVRIINGHFQVIRGARGYSPLSIKFDSATHGVLATGGHQKSSVALTGNRSILIGQHLGDLESRVSRESYEKEILSLSKLYDRKAEIIIRDLHPEYYSSQYARKQELPTVKIQHHLAHICGCMHENGVEPPCLGVAWDGTGYGTDHTIWGGEFIIIGENGWERIGHLRTFPLPGGEKAVYDSRRTAIGLIYEIYKDKRAVLDFIPTDFEMDDNELRLVLSALENRINCPRTSSIGRLYDAVAAILGLCYQNDHEGHAASVVEYYAAKADTPDFYKIGVIQDEGKYILSTAGLVKNIIMDLSNGIDKSIIAAKFQNGLVDSIVKIAKLLDIKKVILSGGCFQNYSLVKESIKMLKANNFRVYINHVTPPNDGGISLGQIAAAHYMGKI